MPTFSEQLAAASTALDAMLAPPPPTETMQTMTAAEALAAITTELANTEVTKDRAAYLKSVLGELSKNNFESTSTVELKVLNDPTLIKPTTATGSIQALGAATPDSNFASNTSSVQKIALVVKALIDKADLKTRIEKSALTAKLDDIKSMFGLTDDDMKNTYDVRWKVGDLIGVLQDAIKLEKLVNGSTTKDDTTVVVETAKAAAPAAPVPEPAWPRDMAGAKFDPVKKAYEPEVSPWAAGS